MRSSSASLVARSWIGWASTAEPLKRLTDAIDGLFWRQSFFVEVRRRPLADVFVECLSSPS